MNIAEELTKKLQAEDDKFFAESEKRNLIENRHFNRASSLGWTQDCNRYLVLKRMYPEQEVITLEQKKNMREGYLQERIMREQINAAGFKVVKTEPLLWPEYNIKGEADDQIELDDIYPIDFKSCSPHVFREVASCKTTEDLLQSKYIWVRHYPYQMICYNHLYNRKFGILLFKNKLNNDKHPVVIPKNDTFMSLIIDGVVQVNEFVKKREFPTAIWIDACRTCGYKESCWKPEERKEETPRIDDVELQLMLARREALIRFVKEYEELDDQIKATLKTMGGTFLVGDFKIDNVKYRKKTYEVPDNIKLQYEKLIEITRTTINYLAGAL